MVNENEQSIYFALTSSTKKVFARGFAFLMISLTISYRTIIIIYDPSWLLMMLGLPNMLFILCTLFTYLSSVSVGLERN